MSKQEFLLTAAEAAKAASALSGLPAGITVAQAALESAWGQSRLSREACNYFGIKAHGKHAVIEMTTTEVRNGVQEKVVAKFARYESMADCFADRDRLISSGAVYCSAHANASDPEHFVRELGKHWATDPNYAEKVLVIYRANALEQLDAVAK
jgi:flagellum-specific peptidoglycan hydrolase FlgJ